MKKQTCEHFDPTEQSIKDCYIHTHAYIHTNIDTSTHTTYPLSITHEISDRQQDLISIFSTAADPHHYMFTRIPYTHTRTHTQQSCLPEAARTIENWWRISFPSLHEPNGDYDSLYASPIPVSNTYILLYVWRTSRTLTHLPIPFDNTSIHVTCLYTTYHISLAP